MRVPSRTRVLVIPALLVLGACGLAGCDDEKDGGLEPDPDVDATGVWELVAGTFLVDLVESEDAYLALGSGSRGSVHLRDGATAINACADVVYATSDATLIMGLSLSEELFIFGVKRSHPDTLELTDPQDREAVFARRAAVPDSLQCGSLPIVARFDLQIRSNSASGLAYDGTSLWLTDANGDVHPVDPATGAVGSPISLSQSRFVHAVQGADFWTHCNCGGNQEAQRRTTSDALVDEVSTQDLANEINIDAIAYDPAESVLWLQGRDRNDDVHRFLKVNSDAEPDQLLRVAAFDIPMDGLATDGTDLWAVVRRNAVARIDPNTLRAEQTYQSPDLAVRWHGIAVVGSSVFLLGSDASDKAVIIQVVP